MWLQTIVLTFCKNYFNCVDERGERSTSDGGGSDEGARRESTFALTEIISGLEEEEEEEENGHQADDRGGELNDGEAKASSSSTSGKYRDADITTDIMMLLDTEKVLSLRMEFEKKEDGLTLAEFVHVMRKFIRTSAQNADSAQSSTAQDALALSP